MNLKLFLHISSSGSVRVTKAPNMTQYDEVTVGVNLSLPDKLWSQPKLQADIVIPDEAAMPQVINADVQERVQEAIRTATNLDFNVKLVSVGGGDESN